MILTAPGKIKHVTFTVSKAAEKKQPAPLEKSLPRMKVCPSTEKKSLLR
jgi:hypothetical protein